MAVFEARRRKLRQVVRAGRLDALLVTNFANVSYLTGFSGDDSYLLVTADDELLVTDLRYTEQLETECPRLPLVARKAGQQMLPTVVDVISGRRIERLGIEAGSMTVAMERGLSEKLPRVTLQPLDHAVENLRAVKDKGEVEAIRQACYVAERAFQVVRAGLRPAVTEFEVATELEYQVRQFGGRCLSFAALVGVGPRAALPHVQPSERPIAASDFTLIDWGARVGHYVSDITRMVITGKISPKFRKLYQVVLDAQLAAIAAIKPGVTCAAVDQAARDLITKAGYGEQFGHGLGHGIGMAVHESPRLSVGQTDTLLEPGMVVTVEPGIYIPGWGGIRIEDDVLVTKTGHELLTGLPKQIDDCVLA